MTPQPFSAALAALLPPTSAPEAAYAPAFLRVADLLLNQATLQVGGHAHRLTEIEFYFNGRQHQDRFTHGDDMQRQFARWYFHRTGGEYRGGTYKGLDLAFGGPDACAGVLLRGMERLEPSELLDGPCVCVDHLLEVTASADIPALVAKFDLSADQDAQGTSPLWLDLAAPRLPRPVYAGPRVGLTLKRGRSVDRQKYLVASYRFLTEPQQIKKGRMNLVVGLHVAGRSAEDIAAVTGATKSQVEKYTKAFDLGKTKQPEDYPAEVSAGQLVELFGACHAASQPRAEVK
jgi:hypothetical protein